MPVATQLLVFVFFLIHCIYFFWLTVRIDIVFKTKEKLCTWYMRPFISIHIISYFSWCIQVTYFNSFNFLSLILIPCNLWISKYVLRLACSLKHSFACLWLYRYYYPMIMSPWEWIAIVEVQTFFVKLEFNFSTAAKPYN